jgi:hypothetical protein
MAGAKVCSKIEFSYAYEQIYIILTFAMVQRKLREMLTPCQWEQMAIKRCHGVPTSTYIEYK